MAKAANRRLDFQFSKTTYTRLPDPIPVCIILKQEYAAYDLLDRVLTNLLACDFTILNIDEGLARIYGEWEGCVVNGKILEHTRDINWLLNITGVLSVYPNYGDVRPLDRDAFVRKPGKNIRRVV